MTTVIEEPIQEKPNRYSLVVLAAKRAKQLKEGAPSLVEPSSTNLLTVALDEIAAGKVTHIAAVEETDDDEVPAHVVTAPAVPQSFLSPSQLPASEKTESIPAELAAFLGTDDATDELSEDEEEDAEDAENEDDEDAEDDLIEKA